MSVYRGRVFECRHQPIALPAPLIDELAARYAEPHRAYHNASHIAEVLGWFDRVADDVGWHEPREVYAAIVFHDAIYDPQAKDNEHRSAAWARRALAALNGSASASGSASGSSSLLDLDRVTQLVELTARHGANATVDHDAALFLDCDMAILGSAPDAFAAYDAAIAREYSHVPPDLFRSGRRAFLAKVLALPRIYLSDYFHQLLEPQARANLAHALSRPD